MSRRFAPFVASVLVAGAVVAACSSSSNAPPSSPSTADAGPIDAGRAACTPGQATPCVCAGGGFGTTICSDAGTTFGSCEGCPIDASAPVDATTDVATDASGDATLPADAGAPDAARDTGAPSGANLVFVHAAPGVPPVRLCIGPALPGGALYVAAMPPIPDAPSTSPAVPALGPFPAVAQGTPGIYPGAIRALPVLANLSTLDVTLFAVLASSVSGDTDADGGGIGTGPDGGPEETCVALLGPHGLGALDTPPGRLTSGVDYVALPAISAGTLRSSTTYLLSLTGCLAGAVSTGGETCGAGYDGGTNAQLGVAQLDTTTVPGGGIGAQFAHRSSALEGTPAAHAPATSGVVPVLVTTAPDGGTSLTPLQAPGSAVTFSAAGLVPSPAGSYAVDPAAPGTQFGALLVPADGGAASAAPYPSGDLLALSLGSIEGLSGWGASMASAPSAFAAGATYTFVLVGDPLAPPLLVSPADGGPPAPNPAYDGRGLHFVAFPNRFTPLAH